LSQDSGGEASSNHIVRRQRFEVAGPIPFEKDDQSMVNMITQAPVAANVIA
jgi:hypothetical protein